MTFEQSKEQAAINHGYENWMSAEFKIGLPNIHNLYKEAAEIYAKANWEEACEAQKEIIKKRYYDIEINDLVSITQAPKPEFKP